MKPKRPLRVNVYAKDVVRVWLKLDPANDLRLVRCEVDATCGESPEWLDDDVDENWDIILEVGWRYSTADVDENEWPEAHFLWGLEHGIAPGQPFLVELPTPNWYRCGGYEYPNEWDVSYDPRVVRVWEWSQERCLAAWERALKEEVEYRASESDRRRRLRELRRTDISKMYVRYSSACMGQCYSDWYSGPHRVAANLCSNATLDGGYGWGNAVLASGYDPPYDSNENRDGTRAGALDALVVEVLKELPHMTDAQVRGLPVRH